jgi:hypothetical protein
VAGGFEPLPHAGHETKEADTHVESHGDLLSDAGSTPAASTIVSGLISLIEMSQAFLCTYYVPTLRYYRAWPSRSGDLARLQRVSSRVTAFKTSTEYCRNAETVTP